jgi:hypothetical protein
MLTHGVLLLKNATVLYQTRALDAEWTNRAAYNLAVRDIILPFKNLIVGRQGKEILGTLVENIADFFG